MSMLKLFPVAVVLLAGGTLMAAQEPNLGALKPAAGDTLVFSSPPRETLEEGVRNYQPLVDYLSKVTGKRVVYRYPRTYGLYRTEMVNGVYDIVFDGAHFNGFRVQKLNHNILVKFPTENRTFIIFVRKGEKVGSVSELAGQTVCSQPPPNVSALVLLAQFNDPSRLPLIVPVKGRDAIYHGVNAEHCTGGILPAPDLKLLDQNGAVKILFESSAMPDQAFSAGPRVTREDQAKIAAALIAPEAAGPTAKIRAKFKGGERFVPAKNDEYVAFAALLRNQWGFFDEQKK